MPYKRQNSIISDLARVVAMFSVIVLSIIAVKVVGFFSRNDNSTVLKPNPSASLADMVNAKKSIGFQNNQS
jgi:hypothetical protein